MTVRRLPGGYELDDDPSRIDEEVVWRFLSEESYWAEGRSRELTSRLIQEASRVVGLYSPDGATVGFCRVLSDGATMAHLFDVFVLPEHRGRGLGVELVREAVELGPHADLPFFLGSLDGQGLYRKFGFDVPNERQMMRPGTRRSD
ncbi:MAG: hypothetical protein QOI81_806 [Actinomycetota bacterium]|jgi:ribosomal protein S18 acetylase RimI-like enzyme|nr:hypothetical protein [Actinomycetota bacterium]